MKKLIFPLLLVTTSFYAAGNEIVNSNDGKNIVSKIKDLEVEKMLSKTAEFNDCTKENPYVAGADESARNLSIQKADECFKKKLGSGKSAEQLKKLSESLNLQEYNLVQSNNVKDIQKYLSDKMYKALTGIDRNNKNTKELLKSMSFKEKQHVDQRDIVEMYRIQLGKNALFEVSKFCFENLRNSSTKDSFAEHWVDYKSGSLTKSFDDGNLNDTGNPRFGEKLSDPENKESLYKEIFSSVQGDSSKSVRPMGENEMTTFFMECGRLIVPLCDAFIEKKKLDPNNTKSNVTETVESNYGAAACLSKERILGFRKAMAETDLVLKEYDKMASQNKSLAENLLDQKVIKLYESGQNDNESTDDLTTYSSSDMIQGATRDELAKQKADACLAAPELANCEDFLSGGDELEKTKHSIEMEMTLKRDIEMARVRALEQGKNKQNLKDYLTENGYFEAEKDLQNMTGDQLAKMVGKAYEAKKIATLARINSQLGKRQISKDDNTPAIIKYRAEEVIQETQEERSRLAQVVLFNNVITSYLSLKRTSADGKTTEEAGRNINAWRKEQKDLETSKVDPTLFQNLSKGTEGQAGIGKDDQIEGFEFIDTILRK